MLPGQSCSFSFNYHIEIYLVISSNSNAITFGCIAQLVEHWAFNLMVAGSSPATPRLETSSNYMITKERKCASKQRSLRFGPVVLKGPSIVARLCSQIAPCTHLTPWATHVLQWPKQRAATPRGQANLRNSVSVRIAGCNSPA